MGVLDGRVTVITGAGRGIGREHALQIAGEGASVVVNDLGGSNSGEGTDVGRAQEVANEIVAAGGKAVANTDNIATWAGAKALVDQAISEFGQLDVVVDNAGILRDNFIASMEESQWDSVLAVHLKGHAPQCCITSPCTRKHSPRQATSPTPRSSTPCPRQESPCRRRARPASAIKLCSPEAATDVAMEAVQPFGGNGYVAEYRVEQLARDAKSLMIYAGSNEVQVTHVATGLLDSSNGRA